MAEPSCGGSVQACAMRVALLDMSGVPMPGPQNLYVINAISKLEATPVYTKGVDMEVVNACGAPSLIYKDMDRFKRYDLTLSLIYLDPELENMLLGTEMFNVGGLDVGGSSPQVASYGGYYPGVSIELWSKHIVNGDIDPVYPYIQWVLPRTRWVIDKITFENNPMQRMFMGYSSSNPNYYNGPANDWALPSDTQLFWKFTTTLPTPTCGAQPLVHS